MELEVVIEKLREYQSNVLYVAGSKDCEPYEVYQRAIEALERERAELKGRKS